MENTTLLFTFKDEQDKDKFFDYVKKYESDEDLKKKVEAAQSEDQVYELLKGRGLIDMSFQDFMKSLNNLCDKFGSVLEGKEHELSQEELESVVGGNIFQASWWKKNWKKVVSYIPGATLVEDIIDVAKGKTKGLEAAAKIMTGIAGTAIEVAGHVVGAPIDVTYGVTQLYERGMGSVIEGKKFKDMW